MSKLNEVINQFEEECEKNPKHAMMRVICNHINEKLPGQPDEVLENILKKKLNIAGAIDKMKETAKKTAVNDCGAITYEEGIEIVDKYFGFNKEVTQSLSAKKTVSLFDIV